MGERTRSRSWGNIRPCAQFSTRSIAANSFASSSTITPSAARPSSARSSTNRRQPRAGGAQNPPQPKSSTERSRIARCARPGADRLERPSPRLVHSEFVVGAPPRNGLSAVWPHLIRLPGIPYEASRIAVIQRPLNILDGNRMPLAQPAKQRIDLSPLAVI